MKRTFESPRGARSFPDLASENSWRFCGKNFQGSQARQGARYESKHRFLISRATFISVCEFTNEGRHLCLRSMQSVTTQPNLLAVLPKFTLHVLCTCVLRTTRPRHVVHMAGKTGPVNTAFLVPRATQLRLKCETAAPCSIVDWREYNFIHHVSVFTRYVITSGPNTPAPCLSTNSAATIAVGVHTSNQGHESGQKS